MFNSILGYGSKKDRPFPHYAIDYFEQIREQYQLTVQARASYTEPKAITDIFARIDAAMAAAGTERKRRHVLRETVHLGRRVRSRDGDDLRL